MPATPPPVPERLAAAATWSRLQAFVAVVDTGTVRAAADALQVTPPAVSAAVSALGKELGVTLLRRSGRGVLPTDAGDRFADYARTMLGLLDEAGAAVRAAERTRLRIGSVATAAEFVLPPLLASFMRANPNVEVSLAVETRDELLARLRHHEVDVVLGGRPPRGSGLVTRARRANRLIAVAAPDLAGREPATSTWLLRAVGSGTRQATLALLAGFDSQPATMTLGTHGAVVAGAREGLGMTLVHQDAVAESLRRGDLVSVPVHGTPLDRPWHLLTAPHAPHGVHDLVRHLCDPAAVGELALRAAGVNTSHPRVHPPG